MPPVGPQGSRGGLITAVVVFTTLTVALAVSTIYLGVQLNKDDDQLAQQHDKTKLIYPSDTSSPYYEYLLRQGRLAARDRTVLGAAMDDSRNFAKLVAGATGVSSTQPSVAIQQARDEIAQVNGKLHGIDLSEDSGLVQIIDRLANAVVEQQNQVTQRAAEATQAAAKAADQIAQAGKMALQAQADEKAQAALTQQYLDQAKQAEQAYQAKVQENSQAMDQERAAFNSDLKKKQAELDAKDRQLGLEAKEVNEVVTRLGNRRLLVNPILRQPDGLIISVPSSDIVYINLGSHDHIVQGMTFEVYDQREGIPKQEDLMSSMNLPVGEGSIEVESIDGASAQCRVIKIQPGLQIKQDDLIANLVYDRNTKYNFVVYGDFDLAQAGRLRNANDRPNNDREKIESLIVNWGGKLQNKIDVDTDFVVMGYEPQVPVFTADELQDPLNVQIKTNAENAAKAYNEVLNNALALNIPIMNQNRFLYFCGYYERAQR